MKCEDESHSDAGNSGAEDTDSDVADAWTEYDQTGRKLAASHVRAQQRQDLPREIARGYIVLADKRIGRLATQPRLMVDPSLHVACFHHACCQQWVPLKRIPDTRLCRIWMARAHEYKNAEEHWEADILRDRFKSLLGVGWLSVRRRADNA